ncbi:hypothetical protein MalM25_11060 [Planctomycetes bacterium MalM25]|nr:hypothetical protein MalM25_11060 [Planctomycetes bacterium MalM25]
MIRPLALALTLLAVAPLVAQVPPPPGPTDEQRIITEATTVFEEMLNIPGQGIPKAMLEGAEGVAIIPRVVKGGFIVGARYGRGVVVTRDRQGVWHAPIFLSITGGNIGWQAGVQSTDLVLIYRTQRSIDSLLAGKLTLGADAAAAAGPVGRQAAAATDSTFGAEIYSYSRSRGLFAGVSLDGSVLKIDQPATTAYYRPPGVPAPVVPAEAEQLVSKVVTQVKPPQPQPGSQPTAATATPVVGGRVALDEEAAIRDQLAEFSPRLYRLLDPAWQSHLSMPAEVFQESGHPSPEALAAVAGRFDQVAADPRYAQLASRPEFKTVHGLLHHYQQLLSQTASSLTLPPPPQ